MPNSGNSTTNPTGGRERQLNIIYFVDANKTRSVKLSISKAKVIGALLFLTISWAAVSTGLLFYSSDRVNRLEDKLSQSLNLIFDYQVKYERIYEKAYPSMPSKKQAAPAATVASAKQSQADSVVEAKPDAKNVTDPGATTLAAKIVEPEDVGPLVSIEDPKVSYGDSKLSVRFALRNNRSPRRATGSVYGTAKFVSKDGAISYLSSPRSIKVSAEGSVDNPKSGYAYRIRYYKAKTMSFVPPRGMEGRFVEVGLSLVGDEGQRLEKKIEVDFPVAVAVTPDPVIKPARVPNEESAKASAVPVSGDSSEVVVAGESPPKDAKNAEVLKPEEATGNL